MNKEGIDKWQADAIVLNKDANQTVQQSVFNKKDIENKYKKQATLKQTGKLCLMAIKRQCFSVRC